MRTLEYWKNALGTAKEMYRLNPSRDWSKAIRYAQRKVSQIEKQLLVRIVCIALMLAVSGCNTLSGIGQDIQALAEYKQKKPVQQQSFEQWERSQLK